MKFELIATSTFGLEAVVKRQIQRLGYEIKEVSDGKILTRSEERRVGKECRSRWSPYH